MIFRTKCGHRYVLSLPSEAGVVRARCSFGVELLQLKAGKKRWTGSNVEPKQGLPLFIYSPYTDWYWYRVLQRDHDIKRYIRYIKDGNLYIHFTDDWKQKMRDERDGEGMKYYDYMKMRELIFLQEVLDQKKDDPSYKTHTRAVQVSMSNLKKKYQ